MTDPYVTLRDNEFAARREHGQMPYHGTSMDELGFTHCREEAERVGIKPFAEPVRDFLSVKDSDIDEVFGTVSGESRTLMLAADDKYFEWFARPLIASMGQEWATAFHQPLHGAREYVHALRFIRFYQRLRVATEPMWMMDVDALFNKSPTELFATLGDKDCAFRIRPGRVEPWNQFSAGIVAASHTALPYFKAIAQFLTYYTHKWFWGIDQLAMFEAYRALEDKPSVSFLDDKVFNLDCTPDGVVWILGGKDKFAMLQGHKFDPETPEGRYQAKFNQFREVA